MMTQLEQRRDTLIRNVLEQAARRGLPVTLAAFLDREVRVCDPETDQPKYVALRDLRADHVRCD